MIDYNVNLLNRSNLEASFFFLDRYDPTLGFSFDASSVFGHAFPPTAAHQLTPIYSNPATSEEEVLQQNLHLRLVLGSHLAQYLRLRLEEEKGYTSTVGISTTKLISKLVGNVNKPKGQTTLLPPYSCPPYEGDNNIIKFLDKHDIGKVPGIGFKMSQKIRQHVLGREPAFDVGLVYGGTKEQVTVRKVRLFPKMGPELLEQILGGPGMPRGIGERVWALINGIDHSEVAKSKEVPDQISIEDSYIKLDTMQDVHNELIVLSQSLLKRMRIDLTSTSTPSLIQEGLADIDNDGTSVNSPTKRQWIALPRNLRLTTRPRPPRNPDGTRGRFGTRISRSGVMPALAFNLDQTIESISDKLVLEHLIPLFHKLHPEKSGWDLSLVNICATNMSLVADDTKAGAGRDIKRMFDNQDEVLKQWKVEDIDMPPSQIRGEGPNESLPEAASDATRLHGSEDDRADFHSGQFEEEDWSEEEQMEVQGENCSICGAIMPSFAMVAHERFHQMPE